MNNLIALTGLGRLPDSTAVPISVHSHSVRFPVGQAIGQDEPEPGMRMTSSKERLTMVAFSFLTGMFIATVFHQMKKEPAY